MDRWWQWVLFYLTMLAIVAFAVYAEAYAAAVLMVLPMNAAPLLLRKVERP